MRGGDGGGRPEQIAVGQHGSVDPDGVGDIGGVGGPERAQQHAADDTGRVAHIETVSSRQVYANNWMTVREDAIRRPDGSPGLYGVIDKPHYALVIAHAGDGRYGLVEQFRYPLGLRRWEFPQGTVGLTELEPAVLAARELREETGLRAAEMTPLGMLDVAAGMSSQRGHVFLASGITEGEAEREHEEQDMHFDWFTADRIEEMMRSGEITDAQSIAAWTLLLLHERFRD